MKDTGAKNSWIVHTDTGFPRGVKEQWADCVTGHLQTLFSKLSSATHALKEGGDKEHRLGCMVLTIDAITEFLESFDEFKQAGLLEPLTAIQSNFKDILLNGVTPEDFEVPASNAKKDTELVKQLRLRCAVQLQMYIDAGVAPDQAAQRMGRLLANIPHLTATRIRSWRRDMSGCRTDQAYDKMYQAAVATLSEHPDRKPAVNVLDDVTRKISRQFKTARLKKSKRAD